MLTMLLMTIDARVGALYNEILAGTASDAFFRSNITILRKWVESNLFRFHPITPSCRFLLSRRS